MGKFVDLTGQTFGEWTVLSYAGVKSKNGYWLCRCSCGKEQENRGTHLRGGQTKSCGHNKNISIGSKFGRLTVLEKITHHYKGTSSYVLWKCQCDCGNISYVRTGALVNHITISCGCYHREQMSEQFAKHIPLGSQFGELTVIEETSERDNSGNILYKVRCSCGKEFIKSGSALRNNIIFSCGHITSKGEYQIHNFLKEHNIILILNGTIIIKCYYLQVIPAVLILLFSVLLLKRNRSFCLNIMDHNITRRKKVVGTPKKTFSAPSNAMRKKLNYVKKQASLLKSFPTLTLTTSKKF